MNLLKKLITRRAELERTISDRRAAAINAEEALTLCDKLEKELPAVVTAIREERAEPFASGYSAAEDFTGKHDLITHRRAVEAAQRLMKDIPAIREHWTKVQASVT